MSLPTNLTFSAITMDEYRKISKFEIIYGTYTTTFGEALLGIHDNNICYISLYDQGNEAIELSKLNEEWPNADLIEDSGKIKAIAQNIFDIKSMKGVINVLLRGTDLQCKVWQQLAKLNLGETTSYQQVAEDVGNPRAIRAIANTIAKNRIAYLIPCHRVVRKSGAPNKYRWGAQRKVEILQQEAAMFNNN